MGRVEVTAAEQFPNRVHVSPREGDEEKQRNEEMRREAVRTESGGGRERESEGEQE